MDQHDPTQQEPVDASPARHTLQGKWGPLFSSQRDDWSTPGWLFRRLDVEYGFGLDAAASPWNAKCARYLTQEDDAFRQDWAARADGHPAWLNFPYGPRAGEWVELARYWGSRIVVVLAFARTDVEWWHAQVMPHAARVGLIRGRLYFAQQDGKTGPAPAPSAVITFQPRVPGPPTFYTIDARKRR